jgi:hypothetical protein
MIDFVLKNELVELLIYIKNNWKKDHIFLKNINVFNFQHNTEFDYFNFLCCKRDGELTAILGLININRFSNNQIWLALWHSKAALDGYLLLNFVIEKIKPDFIGVLGLSEVAKKIYKLKGFETGFLQHYYISKPETSFKLLNTYLVNNKANDRYDLLQNLDFEIVEHICCYKFAPIKQPQYYFERYVNNPFYHYQFLSIYNDNVLKIILIGRVICVNEHKIFHCVDCIGDIHKILLKNSIQKFLIDYNYDIFEFLFFSSDHTKIDMFLKSNNEIIPTYFSPYIFKNIQISLAYKSINKLVRFYIGDSDQDRLNT